MSIKESVQKMDALVSKGEIIPAVQQYFCDHASTSDYNNIATSGKSQMVEKMEGFLGSIAKVNAIKHHNTIVDGNHSASEFTFDFDMKDGTKIFWHEIINRTWNDELKVTNEEYFKAN